MPHHIRPSIARHSTLISLGLCALVTTGTATAQPIGQQPQPSDARLRFERQVAACNSAGLPDPQREACIRSAGAALDRARGGPPGLVPQPSPDGRAVVVAPPGAVPPAAATEAVTTPGGRATVVVPAEPNKPASSR